MLICFLCSCPGNRNTSVPCPLGYYNNLTSQSDSGACKVSVSMSDKTIKVIFVFHGQSEVCENWNLCNGVFFIRKKFIFHKVFQMSVLAYFDWQSFKGLKSKGFRFVFIVSTANHQSDKYLISRRRFRPQPFPKNLWYGPPGNNRQYCLLQQNFGLYHQNKLGFFQV